MNSLLELLKDSGFIAASIAFILGFLKYLSERRDVHYWKEFEVFHRLVKELVEPDKEKIYLDRQAAVIFELRNFKRYYSFSLRMLKELRKYWNKVPDQFPRLIREIDLTIEFIDKKRRL
jgi:hypothetical protein